MLGFFLGFFHVPWFWLGLLVLAAVAVGLYFWKGPVFLLKVAVNPHLWLAIVVALGVMSLTHLEKENKDLKAQVEQQHNQATSDQDGQKTTDIRVKQKTQRQAQGQTQQHAIDNAKPGHAQDDLLDEIAAERPDLNSSASAPADGVRKHVDGAVKP